MLVLINGILKFIFQVEISEPGCAIMKYSHGFLCAGDTSGNVSCI